MSVTSNNYSKVYRDGIASGFDIMDARQYYVKEMNMRPDLEQMMSTPWQCDGSPVYGYTVTNVDLKDERKRGERETNTHEFWIYDDERGFPRNLDDVKPNGYTLVDMKTGQSVDFDTARERMGDFASAASYYPHVFMAAEYAEARNYLNARMGLGPVTDNDYLTYLKQMEKQVQSRDITVVGKIKKLSDMHIAYESLDGYSDYYDLSQNVEDKSSVFDTPYA